MERLTNSKDLSKRGTVTLRLIERNTIPIFVGNGPCDAS